MSRAGLVMGNQCASPPPSPTCSPLLSIHTPEQRVLALAPLTLWPESGLPSLPPALLPGCPAAASSSEQQPLRWMLWQLGPLPPPPQAPAISCSQLSEGGKSQCGTCLASSLLALPPSRAMGRLVLLMLPARGESVFAPPVFCISSGSPWRGKWSPGRAEEGSRREVRRQGARA